MQHIDQQGQKPGRNDVNSRKSQSWATAAKLERIIEHEGTGCRAIVHSSLARGVVPGVITGHMIEVDRADHIDVMQNERLVL